MAALTLVAGCAGGGGKAARTADDGAVIGSSGGSSAAAPAAPSPRGPQPDKAVVSNEPVVASQPYGLPGTTGYQTVVAFKLSNPSDFPMISPYRVTVRSGATVAAVSTGSDTVVLAPHEQRIVVAKPGQITGTKPDSATVDIYANQAGQMSLPDPNGWRITNRQLSCNTGFVGCQATIDLAYQGSGGAFKITGVDIVLHDSSGTFLGAGSMTPSIGGGSNVAIGLDPVPLSGNITSSAVQKEGKQIDPARPRPSSGSSLSPLTWGKRLFKVEGEWPPRHWLSGVIAGCSGTVLGGVGCRGCETRTRSVRRP